MSRKLNLPASSHIGEASYDPETRQLSVTYERGHTHVYAGVPASVVNDWESAPSAGEFHNRHLRGRYPVA